MSHAPRPHPVPDSAEVSIDFPGKVYVGTFSRGSDFSVGLDEHAMHFRLERHGEEKRQVALHIHYGLATALIEALADAVEANPAIDATHLAWLRSSTRRLAEAMATASEGGRTSPS